VKDIAQAELKRFPVEQVSLVDAESFLDRLNNRQHETGWVYRLPKEAEWEYACRGGPLSDKVESAYDFYFDKPANHLLPEQANFDQTGLRRTCKVGSYKPNRLGLYDMHGNVFEWCDDAEPIANGDPRRATRGGCWVSPSGPGDSRPGPCRAAYRWARPPTCRENRLGLRVVRVPVGREVVEIPSAGKKADLNPGFSTVGLKPNFATTAPKISGRPFLVRGEWRIENDELVQPSLATGEEFYPLLAFGEETLANYDLTLEMKKTGGRNAMGVYFHWLGPGHYRQLGLEGNRRLDFSSSFDGKRRRKEGDWKWINYSSNRWYSLKIEVRGDTFRASLDGVLQFEKTADPQFTQGRICLFTDATAARFRRIKVSDPQGKVLFEGVPELPPHGNMATPIANNGQSSRLLTAEETAAKSAQGQWAKRLNTPVTSTNSLGMKLALIPPGEFQMGSPESEAGRGRDEPQHRVRITKPFYLSVDEITQSEFERVMGRNPSWFSNTGGPAEAATGVDTSRYPVENVTWYDAVEFCNKLSEQDGRRPHYLLVDIEREGDGSIKEAKASIEEGGGYCLPTEAQWEYACRAGTMTPFSFGTANNATECNCNGTLPYGTEVQGPALGRTTAVGSYRPNAFGLYDMHGNVNEWCWDIFDRAYYRHSPETDPAGPGGTPSKVTRKRSRTKKSPESDAAEPSGDPLRVLRGGYWGTSWGTSAAVSRAAFRYRRPPGFRGHALGFRVARTAEE